jgi:PAS domain S-box-containing protein
LIFKDAARTHATARLSAGELFFGVIACYPLICLQYNEALRGKLTNLGAQLGQFIQRKETEETLRSIASLIESSTDAFFELDLDGKMSMPNRAAYEGLGFSKKNVIGRSMEVLRLASEENSRTLACVQRGRHMISAEMAAIAKGNLPFLVAVSAFPFQNHCRTVVGATIMAVPLSKELTFAPINSGVQAQFELISELNITCIPPGGALTFNQ